MYIIRINNFSLFILSRIADVKDAVFPPSIKAMLSELLFTSWYSYDEQRQALKQAVGLETPDSFWSKISAFTSAIAPRDKVYVISAIVPFFGSGSEAKEKIELLPNVIESVNNLLIKKNETEGLMMMDEIQLLSSEFAICDYLLGKFSAVAASDRLLRYINQINLKDLLPILKKRKQVWTPQKEESEFND